MQILSVFDEEFRAYGRVWDDVDPALTQPIANALATRTPLPDATDYVPTDPAIQDLDAAMALAPVLFGGQPVEFGWCNGHNLALNCLEYHRSSEFNLGVGDFVLLLALQADIHDGQLDTSTVKAFRVPANTLVEVYCHHAALRALSGERRRLQGAGGASLGHQRAAPQLDVAGGDGKLLWANNKWLLAHPSSAEAAQGAHVGLVGDNVTIRNQE